MHFGALMTFDSITQTRLSFWSMLPALLGSPDDVWYYEAFNRAGNHIELSYGMLYRIDTVGEEQITNKEGWSRKIYYSALLITFQKYWIKLERNDGFVQTAKNL